MDTETIRQILTDQRSFFRTGKTLDLNYRLANLKKLRTLILDYEPQIVEACWNDFHKPEFEVLATETRFVLTELNHAIRRVRKWSKPKSVWTPLVHFLSYSYITPQPYGQVLVLSPWNYPFQLAFLPLLSALAAGNCVILKSSQQVPHVTAVMEKILSHFPPELVAMTNGDHAVSEFLLNHPFDYIFFTGSTRIGRHVMEKAAVNLTPVSLELGGKNPCVVAADARLDFAARRIAWGKFVNAGQTCICTDYVLVDQQVKDRFLELLVKEIHAFYGSEPEKSKDFARIINCVSLDRLDALLKAGTIVTGGFSDRENIYLAPTVISDISPDDPVMQDEVFGPVLPVLTFTHFDEVYPIIARNPKPLATYIFSRSKALIREFLQRTQSGTAGVNETVMQIASPFLPYGGVGNSGIGRYHGKKSFETFSNLRSVLVKSNLFDINLRYPPYTRFKKRAISLFMR
jgi:acyl-CoA reductase-like NAD-dependent aldehyde dehydrogenase